MPSFPGTTMSPRPALERLTLAQQLKAKHPLALSAETGCDQVHTVAEFDVGYAAALARANMEAIRATITEALQPMPHGAGLALDTLAGIAQRLNGHMACLLPIAEAKGLDRAIRAYLRRRIEHGPPSAHDYPVCTRTWLQDNARACQMLLGLVIADEAAEQQHVGVGR
ncbi:hypothetical protein [Streptomyces sp. NPDC000405]|uniref:hypothetical protein n=1 Tax=Streptomyces sp. NPDC000405 TaxID=3161033 RepID=UPI00398C8AE0